MSIDVYPPRTLDAQTYEEGSFTVTATGFSGTAPSGTVRYIKIGKQVTVLVPNMSGTSNTTAFTLTGWPSNLMSVALVRVPCVVQDNGVFKFGIMQLSPISVDIFSDAPFSSWQATGTKGLFNPSFSYTLF